ncbi:MAG: reverse transcriptase N-terminal domain-containing protein [Microcystis sp. M114S2]|uniref:reverse transcriptase N-terminal domain-containing protein n=1 Tax=unclassified Microcystis TaxID=2643300 RepID=UPI001230C855|nr:MULTISPECIES: reverse transcriptase N-terminal domain-containing protein [Microcystis]MDJ0525492.1 reverse transcriptase N-terminal domain-containing protein [Microcystis sp. M53600_WE12]NCR77750.1 hypothetical protein [Microcystis aeruginosa K13-06]MCA2668655.1 reverse transcriptase N-terminal domain-containing protein [Microcystis sp. M045S2]MCA2714691.1 reverse transcriptase N-terminal domain-containing protein [Microcystis sp. M172S2]MCA2804465.1 reverse transcriptase N-terminal domain-
MNQEVWKTINWAKVQRYVFKLQKRIFHGAKTSCIPNNGTVKLGNAKLIADN